MTVQFVFLLCSHPFDYDLRPDTDKLALGALEANNQNYCSSGETLG